MRVRPTSTPACLFYTEFMLKGWSWAVDTSLWKYQSMQIKAFIRKCDRLKDERREDHPIFRTHIFPCCFAALVASTGELQRGIVVGYWFLNVYQVTSSSVRLWRKIRCPLMYGYQSILIHVNNHLRCAYLDRLPERDHLHYNGLLYEWRFLCSRCILSTFIVFNDWSEVLRCVIDGLSYFRIVILMKETNFEGIKSTFYFKLQAFV